MTLEEILVAKEGEHFEFKKAGNRFSYTELQKYASAIANEGGGKVVFGVSDSRPRKTVGTKAFDQPERTRKGLIDSLHINKGEITYAALILFGTHEALGEFLGNSELVFEYRVNEASGPAGQREEFRQGFFGYFDRLWELINLRNLRLPYQEGFFLYDIFAFNERAVREAILNAVCHRNYQLPGSVFVRQYNDRIEFESPGGLPPGITVDNILDRQSARNRRLAEIIARCGLVERSGQGMNLIFEESIREAKELPDFSGTDDTLVRLRLGALITNPETIRLFKEIGDETLSSFSTDDFRAVRCVLDGKQMPRELKSRVPRLVELGVLERVDRNRLVMAQKYYQAIGQTGKYTRLRGISDKACMELLCQHMENEKNRGLHLMDFAQVLPAYSPRKIQRLLNALAKGGKVRVEGRTKGAKWYLIDFGLTVK